MYLCLFVICKKVLPHTRNLVIIKELEKVSEILYYNISETFSNENNSSLCAEDLLCDMGILLS